jgi:hypothetical protein
VTRFSRCRPLVDLAWRATATAPVLPRRRIFDDEVLTMAPLAALPIDPDAADWLCASRARISPALRSPASSAPGAAALRVSRVDHYVDCPFKYLPKTCWPEEAGEEAAGLTPSNAGMLVHQVFEEFFRLGSIRAVPSWRRRCHRRAIHHTHGSGHSAAARGRSRWSGRGFWAARAPGIADRFELEVDAGGQITRRLLNELRGPFDFPQLGALKTRTIEIAGKWTASTCWPMDRSASPT